MQSTTIRLPEDLKARTPPLRYAVERTLTVNTAAVGGNARLLGEE